MCALLERLGIVKKAVKDSVAQAGTAQTTKVRPAVATKGKAEVTLHLKPFAVEARLADNHVCGGYDGQFTMSCDLTVTDLDGAGFVTDNMSVIGEIRQAFGRRMLKASCEELALGVVNVVHRQVGFRLKSVNVQVFNVTGHANASWVMGNEVPAFPREATRDEIRETERARQRREPVSSC